MERNPGRQDFTTHTRTHTTQCDTRTHTHTITCTHTHTQGHAHAHKHIQTHANTCTHKKTHTLATLPADEARHARQLVGHGGEQTDRPSNHTSWRCSVIRSVQARPQGVENSELGYIPARHTTLLHCGARKADSGSMARTLTQKR